MTGNALPLDYDYLDSRDYSLFYTMIGKAQYPLDYDTETVQNNFYYTRWQLKHSPLYNDTETLQTTLYSQYDR